VGVETALKAFTNMEKIVPVHRELTRGKNKGTIKTTYEPEAADSLWEIVVSYYEAKGLTEEDALVQARVASICRYTNFNYQSKEVILWQPPK
jgi:DNA polymerase-1